MATGNMKVGTKLTLGFGAVMLLLTITAGISIKDMSALNGEVDSMVNDKFPKVVWASNVTNNINLIARSMRNTLIMKDQEAIRKELERIQEARKTIQENLDKIEKAVHSEEGKKGFKAITDAREEIGKAPALFLLLA